MHYYYDNESPEEDQAQPGALPAEAPPAAPFQGKSDWGTGEAEPPKRRKKDHTERGAAALLLCLTLVLGSTAVLLCLRAEPLTAGSFLPGGSAIVIQPTASVTPEADLQRAPNGDGTVLTLADRPEGETMRFQRIYSEVAPAVVFIRAATSTGIAQGTGVIMSTNGYIITNAHVIEGSFRVDVSLTDGAEYEALLVGKDTSTDLAVLKIDAQDLPAAVFGDSDQMEVGDVVVAIGNPMGEELRGTMTDGMISAINRDMEVDGSTMTLIQTTAALNTGNSGGALINDMGQVIGITNMKLMAYNSTVEGLGFAIPSTTVKTVVDDLIESGVVTGRPVLGITVQPLSPAELAERDLAHGLWVKAVEEKSDAKTQGLQVGDVLLAADGVDLDRNDDLLQVRQGIEIGAAIEFQVWRAGETLEFSVKLMDQYQLE